MKKMYYWLIGVLLVLISNNGFAQQNLFGKSKEDIRGYFKEANYPLIDSGVSKGIALTAPSLYYLKMVP